MKLTSNQGLFLSRSAVLAALFFIGGQGLFGCANKEKYAYQEKELTALATVQAAIIQGYFGVKAESAKDAKEHVKHALSQKLEKKGIPKPEGSGERPPCFRICLDEAEDMDVDMCFNKNSTCRHECPDEYEDLCESQEADEQEIIELEEPEGDVRETVPVEPSGQSAKIVNTGNNNVILNVQGSSGVTVHGGSGGPKGNTANPIEQAMADLLRRRPHEVKSDLQEGKEAALDTLSIALPYAAGYMAADVIKAGFRAAGDSGHNVTRTNASNAYGEKSYSTGHPDQSRYDDYSDRSRTTTTTTQNESGQIGDSSGE